LDLKAFISSNAFYYPAFFYKQLELTRFVFALISDILKSRSEVDTTGGKPIMFDNALELYFFLVVRGLGNFYEIKKPQDARDGYDDQKQCDQEHLSHLSLLVRSPTRKSISSARDSPQAAFLRRWNPTGANGGTPQGPGSASLAA
jgi:hypothetical protein